MSTRLAQCSTWVRTAKPNLKNDAISYFRDAVKADPKSVLVVMSKASYSGYLLNGRCYPGIHMEQGIPTWCSQDHGGISPYDLPVLMFHDEKQPAIGRVVEATYHRIAGGDSWFNDWKQPASAFQKGSGYTYLKMAITDLAAQEAFLDGRYATFSTSFRSPYAGCSICHTNLLKETCDHVVGEEYELEDGGGTRECYIVTGAQFNKEVSVVNNPAQPWAVAENIKWASDLKDALCDTAVDAEELFHKYEMRSGLLETVDAPQLAVFDSAGKGTLLSLTEKQEDSVPSRGNGGVGRKTVIQVPDLSVNKIGAVKDQDSVEPLDEDEVAVGHIVSGLLKRGLLKTDEEMKDICCSAGHMVAYMSGLSEETDGHTHLVYLDLDLNEKKIRGYTSSTFITSKDKKVGSHYHSIEFDAEDLNSDSWKGRTRDASSGGNHTHDVELVLVRDAEYVPSMEKCLDLAQRFDTLIAQDADVGPSLRKKLKTNHSCGPGGTFPVSDRAHVEAALKLLPRFKGTSQQKAEILKKIWERADVLQYARDAGTNPKKTHEDNMDPKDKTGTADQAGKLGEDSIKVITDALKSEQNRNKELQSQFDAATAEKNALATKLTDSEKKLHGARCEHLALLRALNGAKPSGHKLEDADGLKAYVEGELIKRTPDSVTDSIRDEMGALSSKLSNLKGLGAFAADRNTARDAGAITRDAEGTVPTSEEKPTPKKQTGKDLV